LDAREIDEVHVFLAPRLVGGATAPVPTAGEGVEQMADAVLLENLQVQQVDSDIYMHGRIMRGKP
jgi:diaminohydroxyphosphoribosylaminopyrimidine deaminase/5-amino-6-(5-phosphoribosylamino)uracil reductase